jgi:hypothetical protein
MTADDSKRDACSREGEPRRAYCPRARSLTFSRALPRGVPRLRAGERSFLPCTQRGAACPHARSHSFSRAPARAASRVRVAASTHCGVSLQLCVQPVEHDHCDDFEVKDEPCSALAARDSGGLITRGRDEPSPPKIRLGYVARTLAIRGTARASSRERARGSARSHEAAGHVCHTRRLMRSPPMPSDCRTPSVISAVQ